MHWNSVVSRLGMLSISSILVLAGLNHAAPKPTAIAQGSAAQGSAAQASAAKANSTLDTAQIRKLYLDGDFDQAIESLELGLKEKRNYNHGDSVFIFKHLGVMYAAKYDTREKGKYYMHQLLAVEPTARILDMYASDMIYMIFKNIQDEFDQAGGRLSRAESHVSGNSQKQPDKNSAPEKNAKEKPLAKNESSKSNHSTLYWVGGSTVAIAAGVTAYFLMADQTSPEVSGQPHAID